MEWSVHLDVVAASDVPAIHEDDLEVFLEALVDHAGSVAGPPEVGPPSYGATLAIEAGDAAQALTEAMAIFEHAARKANLPEWPITSVEVIEWNEFERRLDEPTYPEVVGVSELADLAGVSKQRASALARGANFPVPFADLASGPVWIKPNVMRFLETWERKPGRPRSARTS